jgi:hypothetical protein
MSRRKSKRDIEVAAGYPDLGRTEGRYNVKATQVTDTLAVNRDLRIDQDGEVDYAATWNVTHIPTGWAMVRGFPTSQVAKEASKLLYATGCGDIETDDPKQANQEYLDRGATDLKEKIVMMIGTSRTNKVILRKIQKETRRASRVGTTHGDTRSVSKRRGPKRVKKVAKHEPVLEVDLLALARKARGNPKKPIFGTKEKLLDW